MYTVIRKQFARSSARLAETAWTGTFPELPFDRPRVYAYFSRVYLYPSRTENEIPFAPRKAARVSLSRAGQRHREILEKTRVTHKLWIFGILIANSRAFLNLRRGFVAPCLVKYMYSSFGVHGAMEGVQPLRNALRCNSRILEIVLW